MKKARGETWIDLIFEGPEMNQIMLRDLNLFRAAARLKLVVSTAMSNLDPHIDP